MADLVTTEMCSNSSHGNHTHGYQLAGLHHLIAGSLVYFLILPFVLFHFRCFPLGSTPAVLLGAFLMVITQVVSQEEAYAVMGKRENMTAIFMLLGMMLMAQFVEREQILVKVLRKILTPDQSFPNYIWRVCVLSFLLSALFTNDACCAILTPLVLKYWETQERSRTELESLLLAIAMSANIGSVCTVFGNPQMALLSLYTQSGPFRQSRLDMRSCFMYLLPTALVCLVLNIGFLVLHQWVRTRRIEKSKLISEPSHSEQEMAGLTKTNSPPSGHTNGFIKMDNELMYEGLQNFSCDRLAIPTSLETIKEDEVLEITENRGLNTIDVEAQERELVLNSSSDSDDSDSDHESADSNRGTSEDLHRLDVASIASYKPNQLTQLAALQEQHPAPTASSNSSLNRTLEDHGLQLSHRMGIYKSVGGMSACEFLPVDTGLNQLSPAASALSVFSPSDSFAFHLILFGLLLGVFILFLASSAYVAFDMGLVPMGAAILVLVTDALLNHRSGLIVIKRVDWSIILLFLGLFVWIYGFNKTHLLQTAWTFLGLADANFYSAEHIAILAVFVLVGSNIFSNVPLTIIMLDMIAPCENRKALVLFLAWLLSIAGNLTMFGSVANLIVVQKGVQSLKYRLTFWQYFQFGFLTTLVQATLGLLIIYALLLIPT